MSKPIDGPWIVDTITGANGPAYQISHLWDDDGETRTDEIAQVCMDYRGEAALQHARLLAAAPAMHDALNEAIEQIQDLIEGDEQADDSEHPLYDLSQKLKAVRDGAEEGTCEPN